MTEMRTGAVAGLLWVIVFVAFLVATGPGPTLVSVGEARQWFIDNGSMYRSLTVVRTLATLLLLLPFAAGLATFLERAAPAERMWARLVFSGAVIAAVIAVVGEAPWIVMTLGAAEGASDMVVQAAVDADLFMFFTGFHIGLALFVGSASVIIVREGVMVRWLGWLGLATVVPAVIAPFWIVGGEYNNFWDLTEAVAFIGTLIWSTGVAIVMLRRARFPLVKEAE